MCLQVVMSFCQRLLLSRLEMRNQGSPMYLNNVGKMPRIAMLIWNGEIEQDHSWNSWEVYNNLYLGSKHEFLPWFWKKTPGFPGSRWKRYPEKWCMLFNQWQVLALKSVMYNLYMSVSKNRGTPKWMVYNGKPYFWKHPHQYFSKSLELVILPIFFCAGCRRRGIGRDGENMLCWYCSWVFWWGATPFEQLQKRCKNGPTILTINIVIITCK